MWKESKKIVPTRILPLIFSLQMVPVLTVVYAQLLAFNIGAEVAGFALLLVSAVLLGAWAHLGKHRGLLLLQVFMPLPPSSASPAGCNCLSLSLV